jgi:hypothetical protein
LGVFANNTISKYQYGQKICAPFDGAFFKNRYFRRFNFWDGQEDRLYGSKSCQKLLTYITITKP